LTSQKFIIREEEGSRAEEASRHSGGSSHKEEEQRQEEGSRVSIRAGERREERAGRNLFCKGGRIAELDGATSRRFLMTEIVDAEAR
jgi:hypothetical protein